VALAILTPPTPAELKDILADHVFVGIVDEPRGLSLVQHATKLYMLNHSMLR